MSRSQKLKNSATHAGKQYHFSTPSERDAFLQTVNAASNIEELSDVTITSPAENEVLSYNGSEWVNAPGGGSSNTITLQAEALTTIPNGALCFFSDYGGVDNMMRVDDVYFYTSAPDFRPNSVVGVNNGPAVAAGQVFEVTMQGEVTISAAYGIDGGNTTIYKGDALYVSHYVGLFVTADSSSGTHIGWALEDLDNTYKVKAQIRSPRLYMSEMADGTMDYMSVYEGALSPPSTNKGDLLISDGYDFNTDRNNYRPYVQGVDSFSEIVAICADRALGAGSYSIRAVHAGITNVPVEGGFAHFGYGKPTPMYTKIGTAGLTVDPASGEFVGFVLGDSLRRDGTSRISFVPPGSSVDDTYVYQSATAFIELDITLTIDEPIQGGSTFKYFGIGENYQLGDANYGSNDTGKIYFVDSVDTSRAQNELIVHTLTTTDDFAAAIKEFVEAPLSPADTVQTSSQGLSYYKVNAYDAFNIVRTGNRLRFNAPTAGYGGNKYAILLRGGPIFWSLLDGFKFKGGYSAGPAGKASNSYTRVIADEDLGAGHIVYQTGWDSATGLPTVTDNVTTIKDGAWKNPLGIVDSTTLTASAVTAGSEFALCTSGLVANAFVQIDPVTSLLPPAGATLCADAENGALLTRDNGSGLPVAVMIYPGSGTYDSAVWFTGGAKDSFLRSTGDGVRMGNTSRISAVGNGVSIPAGVALKHSGAASNVAGKYTLFETGNAANLIVGLSATKSTGADTSADAFSLCTGGLVGSVIIKDAAGAVIGTAAGAIEGQVVYTGDGTTNAAHVLTTDPTSGVAVGIVHEATKHGITEPNTWTVLFQPSRLH